MSDRTTLHPTEAEPSSLDVLTMTELKIAHIVTEVPWPPDKGGKVSFYNHITELAGHPGVTVSLVLLDADGDRRQHASHFRDLGIETMVFDRALPHVSEGFLAGARALLSFLLSCRPRICRVRRNAGALAHMESLLEGGIDAIVFEHISGWEMVPAKARGRVPIVYVTHNVEQKVALDQFRFQRTLSPLKLFFLGEYLKTVIYERRMMRHLSAAVSISCSDAAWYSGEYPRTTHLLTDERIPGRESAWSGSGGGKRLLFVGSHRYFPNLDALEWLTRELMPRLRSMDDGITLDICGPSAVEAAKLRLDGEGIRFLGFLDDRELGLRHCESDLYVCPIRLGSGIKMKILDALSYGMPVAAVAESLEGIGVGGLEPCLDFDDPDGSAARVCELLRDGDGLREISRRTIQAVEAYRINRRRFDVSVLEAVGTVSRTGSGTTGHPSGIPS